MKKILLIAAMAALCISCKKAEELPEKQPDKVKIGNGGQLYMVRQMPEGGVLILPATTDDCRKMLEENGEG